MGKVKDKYDKSLKSLFNSSFFIEELLKFLVAEEWIKNLDFSTLTEEKTDFLTEDLQEFREDSLWSIEFKKEKILIYIHIEFQSKPDETMPFRFLNYYSLLQIDAIKKKRDKKLNKSADSEIALKDNSTLKKNQKKKKLSFIFPILFYIGKSKWNHKMKIKELVEIPFKGAEKYIPNFEIFEIMLQNIGKEKLIEMESILANILATGTDKITEEEAFIIGKNIDTLLENVDLEKAKEITTTFFKFFTIVSESEDVDLDFLRDILGKKGGIMTGLAKVLDDIKGRAIELGIAQGIEKGKLEGKLEGLTNGERLKAFKIAQKMLKRGNSIEEISEITELSIEEIKNLKIELEESEN